MNFGSLNINPGDTQSIIVAQIVAQGTNNLNSVTILKQNSVYLKNVFENNFTNVSVKESDEIKMPENVSLFQNYPNPFNPATTINFEIKETGLIVLRIYDINGREIETLINRVKSAGKYAVKFNGSYLASGIYFYQISDGKFSNTKKMILNK